MRRRSQQRTLGSGIRFVKVYEAVELSRDVDCSSAAPHDAFGSKRPTPSFWKQGRDSSSCGSGSNVVPPALLPPTCADVIETLIMSI